MGFFASGAAVLVPALAHAALNYSTVDSVQTENFNSLAASPLATDTPWTNNSTIGGFYIFRSGAINSDQGIQRAVPDDPVSPAAWAAPANYRPNSTSTVSSRIYSWGNGTASERGLGGNTGSTSGAEPGDIYYALVFRNLTGETLDSFTLGYTGEQWTVTSNAGVPAQGYHFDYLVTSSFDALADIPTSDDFGPYTAVPSLDFVSPKQNIASSALDGNDGANRVVLSETVNTSFTWAPNDYLILRWWDDDSAGGDYGMAIDDISFSATAVVPEPTGAAAVILAGGILLTRRRNRKS